jgi:hypothetical protein
VYTVEKFILCLWCQKTKTRTDLSNEIRLGVLFLSEVQSKEESLSPMSGFVAVKSVPLWSFATSPTFRKNIILASLGSYNKRKKQPASLWLLLDFCWLFDRHFVGMYCFRLEDGSSTFLRNIIEFIPDYTVSVRLIWYSWQSDINFSKFGTAISCTRRWTSLVGTSLAAARTICLKHCFEQELGLHFDLEQTRGPNSCTRKKLFLEIQLILIVQCWRTCLTPAVRLKCVMDFLIFSTAVIFPGYNVTGAWSWPLTSI